MTDQRRTLNERIDAYLLNSFASDTRDDRYLQIVVIAAGANDPVAKLISEADAIVDIPEGIEKKNALEKILVRLQERLKSPAPPSASAEEPLYL